MRTILLAASVLAISTTALANKGYVYLKGCPAADKLVEDVYPTRFRAFNEHDGARVIAASGGDLKPGATLTLHCKRGPLSESCKIRNEDEEPGRTHKVDFGYWVKITWEGGRNVTPSYGSHSATEPSCD